MKTTRIEPTAIVEVDPRERILPRQQWRYTARPEWSSAGESLWMRLSKFSHCNRMAVAELARLFVRQDAGDAVTGIDLRSPALWDLQAIALILEICLEDVQASFCCDRVHSIATRASFDLRYCEFCLVTGFHAAWFQWPSIERCPRHDSPLKMGCSQCAAAIPYVHGVDLALSPLRCMNCHRDWVPDLARAAGRCAPMSARDTGLMCRWADCVHEFISIADSPVRDWKTGRFISANSVSSQPRDRPHVLTMLNRLFDDPPPTLRDMAAQLTAEPQLLPAQAAAIISAVDVQLLGYRLTDWPHFALGFATQERLVRAARTRVFQKPVAEFNHERGYHLLAANLVAPTATIDCATAATLGWSISWFSPCQALAPHSDFGTPAFGLASWLARLPLRPATLPPQAWNRRVKLWLLDDLALSARLWERMADFMSSRGHYLLYGEAVSPKALAALHDIDDN